MGLTESSIKAILEPINTFCHEVLGKGSCRSTCSDFCTFDFFHDNRPRAADEEKITHPNI